MLYVWLPRPRRLEAFPAEITVELITFYRKQAALLILACPQASAAMSEWLRGLPKSKGLELTQHKKGTT